MNELNIKQVEKEVAGIVTWLYEAPGRVHYPYHNLAHTEGVVVHAREMAAYYLLKDLDVFVLVVSAWFHDVGHLFGEMNGHEERSVLIMREQLKSIFQSSPQNIQQSILPYLVDGIERCILATKMPSHPVTLLEQIICDADTYHVGTSLFKQTDVLVEREMEMRTGKTFPDWHRKSLQFLERHQFFTGYCRNLLGEGKKQNIAWVANKNT